MEVCQGGFYMEDFKTQEVPAGFDFASFGEFFFFFKCFLRELILMMMLFIRMTMMKGPGCLCSRLPVSLEGHRK